MRRASSFILLPFFLLALCVAPLQAQSAEPTVTITAVDNADFPTLNVYLAVNAPGATLPPSAFALTENGQPMSGLAVRQAQLGLQIVLVLDTSAAFEPRDVNGLTRLDLTRQSALEFVDAVMADGVDDVSVMTPEGLLIGHSTTRREIVAVLNAYSTTFTGAADPLAILNLALDDAASPTPRPGMAQAVVVFSNGYPKAEATALADLAARASAARVVFHTIFVGPVGAGNTAGAQTLQQLAGPTGGTALIFESPATVAPLWAQLAEARTQYQLTYRSAITTTAQHTVAARLTLTTGVALTTTPFTFPLRVEPPMVKLGEVPTEISLLALADGTTEPPTLPMPFLVDFPDNHPRDLSVAQLLVDGQVVATQTTAEALAWDLGDYTTSGPHTLQVSITDALGLTATTDIRSITLTVSAFAVPVGESTLASNAMPTTAVNGWWLTAGVGLIGLALGLVGWQVIVRLRRRQDAAAPTAAPDRVDTATTTPVSIAELAKTAPLFKPPTKPRARLRITRPRLPGKASAPQTLAYFEVVEAGGGGATRPNIELTTTTCHLGRDAALAEIVFHDRSVSRRHARLEALPDGAFRIYDEGSTSGTWVNFTIVPPGDGWELRPGDLVNLGRVQLRFKRRDMPPAD